MNGCFDFCLGKLFLTFEIDREQLIRSAAFAFTAFLLDSNSRQSLGLKFNFANPNRHICTLFSNPVVNEKY